MKIARREVPAEIPTASMADVAFLLIIFFLVASFYSVTRGIQFSLPKNEEAALTSEPEAAVLIEIESNGALTVTPPRDIGGISLARRSATASRRPLRASVF